MAPSARLRTAKLCPARRRRLYHHFLAVLLTGRHDSVCAVVGIPFTLQIPSQSSLSSISPSTSLAHPLLSLRNAAQVVYHFLPWSNVCRCCRRLSSAQRCLRLRCLKGLSSSTSVARRCRLTHKLGSSGPGMRESCSRHPSLPIFQWTLHGPLLHDQLC